MFVLVCLVDRCKSSIKVPRALERRMLALLINRRSGSRGVPTVGHGSPLSLPILSTCPEKVASIEVSVQAAES